MTLPIIFALDFPSLKDADKILKKIDISWVKVGLELFSAEGPAVVTILKKRGYKIMLDLKLLDIPTTVERAVKQLVSLEPELLTIHSRGGEDMIGAAVSVSQKTQIIAVSNLTSEKLYVESPLIGKAVRAGAHGVVCSASEALAVRDEYPHLTVVTPGVRLTKDARNEHLRVETPWDAISNGATYVVMGRPIRDSLDPRATLKYISEKLKEIE